MTEEKKEEGSKVESAATADKQADTPVKQEGAAVAGESKPKKKKNGWVVLGIVAAVIVIVCIAFNVWHSQPSFCNAICHSPMDNYVESYYSGDEGMLVTPHAKAGLNCLSCHNPQLGEQVSEVGAWMGDNYPLDEYGNLSDDSAQNMASSSFCLKSGCHNWNDVVDSTWGFAGNDAKYNPHSSHQDGSVQCGDCHKSHSTSTLYCAKCHQMNLPEGWEATSE